MVGYAKIFSDFIESPEFLDAMLVKLTDLEIEHNKAFLTHCGKYIDWLRMSPEDLEALASDLDLRLRRRDFFYHTF